MSTCKAALHKLVTWLAEHWMLNKHWACGQLLWSSHPLSCPGTCNAGSSSRVSYLRRGRSTASRARSRFFRLFSRSELSLSSTSAWLACSQLLNLRPKGIRCIQLETSTRWLPASRMENGQQAWAWGWRLHMLSFKGPKYPLM